MIAVPLPFGKSGKPRFALVCAVTGAPAGPYAKRKSFFKAGLREVIRPLAAAVSLHQPETLFNRASAGLLVPFIAMEEL